jgi:hypothetical protein
MTDWVQNKIELSRAQVKKAAADPAVSKMMNNLCDLRWMQKRGFRADDTFGVEKKNGAITIYADTKWDPPIDFFKSLAKKGLEFRVMYCDIYNYAFVGAWYSDGLRIHVECNPVDISKNMSLFLRKVPSELRNAFEFEDRVKSLG